MSRVAILVEDDPEQVSYAEGVLGEFGFTVAAFTSAGLARQGAQDLEEAPGLIVLDRRLPLLAEDEPDDRVGDLLLEDWLGQFPATPFVVLTGFSGVEHMQFVTAERGQFALGGSRHSLDRVRPFTKDQTPEFERYLRQLADIYDELDSIEVIWHGEAATSAHRLLKRVAQECEAPSLSVVQLTGGLADQPVFACEAKDDTGRLVASRIVKIVDRGGRRAASGLHSVLPAHLVAAHVGEVEALATSGRAVMMQIAGLDPIPLLQLLDDSGDFSLAVLRDLLTWPWPVGSLQTVTVRNLMAPVLAWTKLESLLGDIGLAPPPPGLLASSRLAVQHGDLHPGNILVSQGRGVLIDFEEECIASSLLDPLTLLLSPWFHKDSPIRSRPHPIATAVETPIPAWLAELGDSDWLRTCWPWVEGRQSSPRELDALVLAYAARQLKYSDVRSDPVAEGRAIALVKSALNRLLGS